MTGQEIVELIKQSIRDYKETHNLEIGEISDDQAIDRLGSGCTSMIIQLRLSHDAKINITTPKLRRVLDSLCREGLLIKRPASPGGWNAYWPAGFADELRRE